MIRLEQPRRRTGESVVPMINVAFLLLIFFLMVAVIAPPDPVALVLPGGETDVDLATNAGRVFVVSGDGEVLAQDGLPATLSNVSGQAVVLRADGNVDAGRVAAIIAGLSRSGATSVQLAVSPD